MKWIALATVAAALATVKVDNELKMTKAYDRQAAALERIAEAVERCPHHLAMGAGR